VRLRTLPLWPGSGVLSSGVTRKSARLVALASFDPPAAAAVPLRGPSKALKQSNVMTPPQRRPAESAGELFLRPALDAGIAQPIDAGPAAARRPAVPDQFTPTFSRRSIVATLAAAFAPSVGTAVALPVIIKAANAIAPAVAAPLAAVPAAESPELLALGAELDTKLDDYRAAAASLEEARAVAAKLWPAAVPAKLIVMEQVDRDRFSDCFEEAADCEGKRVYRPVVGMDGKTYHDAIPLYVLRSERLRTFLTDVRDEPDCWEDWVRDDLIERINVAER
jgi:hypothetical protein